MFTRLVEKTCQKKLSDSYQIFEYTNPICNESHPGRVYTHVCVHVFPYIKVLWANMGPPRVLSAPDGPHVGPMNLAIRVVTTTYLFELFWCVMEIYYPGATQLFLVNRCISWAIIYPTAASHRDSVSLVRVYIDQNYLSGEFHKTYSAEIAVNRWLCQVPWFSIPLQSINQHKYAIVLCKDHESVPQMPWLHEHKHRHGWTQGIIVWVS